MNGRDRRVKRAYPKYVNTFVEKGKRYAYYRPPGGRSIPLPDPQTDHVAFLAAYLDAIKGVARPIGASLPDRSHADGTWNAALDLWVASDDYRNCAASTRKNYSHHIERIRLAWGSMPMRGFTAETVAAMHQKRLDAGEYGSANILLTVLKKSTAIARRKAWITVDLVGELKKQKSDGEGYRPYEDWEVDRWRVTHAIGTPARLMFELAYNHALGRAELARLAPMHIEPDGRIKLRRQKTGKAQNSPILEPDLIACIRAAMAADPGDMIDMRTQRSARPLLEATHGRPIAADTLGRLWRQWAAEAKVGDNFNIHGGRKSVARDAINGGANDSDGMRLTGHAEAKMYRYYGASADDDLAADRAMAKVREARQRRRQFLQTQFPLVKGAK